jgi:hypothetical protein
VIGLVARFCFPTLCFAKDGAPGFCANRDEKQILRCAQDDKLEIEVEA